MTKLWPNGYQLYSLYMHVISVTCAVLFHVQTRLCMTLGRHGKS